MHEVEGNVGRACLPCCDDRFELREERARRCFCLYKPAHVVLHLALGEFQALPLGSGEHGVRWEQVREVLKHIAQGCVVVADLLPWLVAAPLAAMLCVDDGRQDLDLHDVVDCCEHQHRKGPLHVVARDLASAIAEAAAQEPGINHQVLHLGPLHLLEEVLPLLQLLLAPHRQSGGGREGVPFLVHAEAEGLRPVGREAHDPVDHEERAQGPLVLVLRGAAARGGLGRLAVAGRDVERELREGRDAILEEVPAGVVLVAQAPRRVPRAVPVRPLAAQELLQEAGAVDVLARGHLQRCRRGQLALGVRRRGLHAQGLVQEAPLEGPLLSLDLREGLPAPACHHHLAAGFGLLGARDRAVCALGQAQALHACAGGVQDAALDLVDAVDGPEPGVGARVGDLLAQAVAPLVEREMPLLKVGIQSQLLLQGRRDSVLPALVLEHAARDGPIVEFVVKLPPLELPAMDQHLLDAEDVRADPDLDDADVALQFLVGPVAPHREGRVLGVEDLVVEVGQGRRRELRDVDAMALKEVHEGIDVAARLVQGQPGPIGPGNPAGWICSRREGPHSGQAKSIEVRPVRTGHTDADLMDHVRGHDAWCGERRRPLLLVGVAVLVEDQCLFEDIFGQAKPHVEETPHRVPPIGVLGHLDSRLQIPLHCAPVLHDL
mmetsp:Transcript_83118/g.258559  ORF Transcript_83118/g.258559 Transcript_83118/m.258559 type:complete len:662 (+) Transcript_83118:952-2937(+)